MARTGKSLAFTAYLERLEALYGKLERKLPLRPPATATALKRLEKQLGSALPPSLHAAWQTSNGSRSDTPFFARSGYLTAHDFLSVPQALEARQAMRRRAPRYKDYSEPKRRDRRIAQGWFQPGWLPFAGFGGGTLLLLVDLSPAARGSAGQVIAFTHDPDTLDYVASSFDAFLRSSATALKRYADEYFLE
jgi:cell wall assembly regulator SMI1